MRASLSLADMANWNETDEPIAYLITFRTYGTWLAGNERGSMDKYHNSFGGPRAVVSEERNQMHQARLKSPPFILTAASRHPVEAAIREVCHYREWALHALAVRTNHAHVVSSGRRSERMLNDFKAYSTKALRSAGEWKYDHSPWVDKGSRRYLWIEEHVVSAVNYVVHGQGGPLPEFD